ncbi:hypothetical protein JOB18_028483 [Solea senegalensis]|uniref:Uncharacterized protein n=1 Tax=Solea senegalensis TaxID=28829 RepID=A0AAV6PCJ0_SOLSE|nr:hypothetical protein JOB18_028483 [Solea senegalensis]
MSVHSHIKQISSSIALNVKNIRRVRRSCPAKYRLNQTIVVNHKPHNISGKEVSTKALERGLFRNSSTSPIMLSICSTRQMAS